MKSVEDYMLDGDCEGCDQDPTLCYELGYCIYDKQEEAEKYESYTVQR